MAFAVSPLGFVMLSFTGQVIGCLFGKSSRSQSIMHGYSSSWAQNDQENPPHVTRCFTGMKNDQIVDRRAGQVRREGVTMHLLYIMMSLHSAFHLKLVAFQLY